MFQRESRRFLLSSPVIGLTGIAVLTLGIGISTLALSLLMTSSSLRHPGMPARAYVTIAEAGSDGGSATIPWSRVEKIREHATGANILEAYSTNFSVSLNKAGGDKSFHAAAVSSGFFGRFTDRLIAGRDFTPSEEEQPGHKVVILSAALAHTVFGSPQAAVGQNVRLNGYGFEVIGVAPPAFHGLFQEQTDLWIPPQTLIPLRLHLPASTNTPPDLWKVIASFYVFGESSSTSSSGLSRELTRALPKSETGAAPLHVSQGISLDPVQDSRIRSWLRLGLILGVTFTFVSSLNFALLLLARTPRSMEEIRLKRALGANTRQLIVEMVAGPTLTVMLSVVLAFLLCCAGLDALTKLPGTYGQIVQASWTKIFPALAMEVPIAIALTALIAILPTVLSLREDAVPRTGHSSTATRRAMLLLQVPVTLQIAFCIATWILAGMIGSSLLTLLHTPLGYDPQQLSIVGTRPGPHGVSFRVGGDDSFPSRAAIRTILERVRAVPGVTSAGVGWDAPFAVSSMTVGVKPSDQPSAPFHTVNSTRQLPGVFRTLGATLLHGEDLPQPFSNPNAERIVISQSLARALWPDKDALGRTVLIDVPAKFGMPNSQHEAIVGGIVADMRADGFASSPQPIIYEPFEGGAAGFIVVVRGTASVHELESAVASLLPALTPGLVVDESYRVSERADASLKPERQRVYAALAAALAMAFISWIGLYGTLIYYVNTRRREMAVRICLGADVWRIRRIIVRRAGQAAAAAMLVALPLWLAMARLSSNDYLGRLSWSTGRAVAISVACAVVSVAVSLLPSMAASSIPPAEALKEQ